MAFRLFPLAVVIPVLLALPGPGLAAATCKMSGLAELPVTMRGVRPTIPAKINGNDVRFMVDSGAFYSIITSASAAALKMRMEQSASGITIKGVGGDSLAVIATAREFGLAGAVINNMEFLAVSRSFDGDVVGVLGQNIFSFADMEYDLGAGVLRLIRAEKCKDADRVYWVKPGEAFSTVTIQPVSRLASQVIGTAYLNGKKIRVLFDTGAPYSILSVRAAERAGVKTNSAGVVQAGRIRGDSRLMPTWIAPFESFRIGEEEIRNTRLRIGDIDLGNIDMLLGADFFLSHRIYVSHSSNKLLFTYRGGAVFDLGSGGNPESIDAPGDAVADARDPTDAQGYSRRGAMYAARRDFARAIADLTRACALAPREPEYFYQRGTFYQQNGQPALALGDFDLAIFLKADHLAARVARAGLRLSRLEATGNGRNEDIIADVDMARSLATKEADIHFDLGRLYAGAGAQEQAMAEFDQWLPLHRDDSRAPDAHALTCRARAVLGRDLGEALDHCNSAVRDRPGVAFPLESRGLVHVRQRNFEKAITDLDKVVAEQPRNAWALYARGLAKIGKGSAAAGEADIAAAKAANPRIVAAAVARGFVP